VISPPLLPLDGSREDEGIALRTALALAAGTGQGFEMTRIGERRAQAGLRPEYVTSVRAAALLCGAKVSGAFDRSPDLRFEPGPIEPGQFRFDLHGADPATPLLQALAVPVATASAASRLEITGGTHVPDSPTAHYLQRQWAPTVSRLGLDVSVELRQAGFLPPGGGEIHARVAPWTRPAPALRLDARGAFVGLRVHAAGARSKVDDAQKQADALRAQLWESQRLEPQVEVAPLSAPSPGTVLVVEIEFERTKAVLVTVGERRLPPDAVGIALARRVLKFLEGEAAVDPFLPDQLAVPLALGKGGGAVSTSELRPGLERVVEVLNAFGCAARIEGRIGGPGVLEVPAW
jgi:RNA 3'-terminal phosphate cyclase (ATP)